MNKQLILASAAALMLTTMSCKDEGDSKEKEESPKEQEARSKEDLVSEIDRYEALLMHQNIDTQLMARDKVLALYVEFGNRFPEEPVSGNYMHKAFSTADELNRDHQALSIADKALDMPHIHNEEILRYQRATLLDLDLRDTARARAAYEEYVEMYPMGQYLGDAKCRLRTMHLSDLELIQLMDIGQHPCADLQATTDPM